MKNLSDNEIVDEMKKIPEEESASVPNKYELKKASKERSKEQPILQRIIRTLTGRNKPFKRQKEEKIDNKKEKLYSDDEFVNVINNSVNKYSNLMKLYPKKITIKQLKYAWGSCSSKKNISFNSELMYKEKDVIDYVVVHELAHLKYMNHQKDFWNLVGLFIPDYKEKRKELKCKNKK